MAWKKTVIEKLKKKNNSLTIILIISPMHVQHIDSTCYLFCVITSSLVCILLNLTIIKTQELRFSLIIIVDKRGMSFLQ